MAAQMQSKQNVKGSPGWRRSLLILEDEPLVATLLQQILQEGGFQVLACQDAVSAKRLVEQSDPDGVLIDINLGEGLNGIQFGEWLSLTHPEVTQIYLTGISDPRLWSSSGDKGHRISLEDRTFISKDKVTETATLLACVDAALQGNAQQRLRNFRNEEVLNSLSQAELEILKLTAEGLTNAAIAKQRGTTLRTVEQQLQAVYKALKLDLDPDTNARVQAVRIYLKASGE